jgi:hypothetical protein
VQAILAWEDIAHDMHRLLLVVQVWESV